jgi:N-hydroxyarylamine O-acetyltransferase
VSPTQHEPDEVLSPSEIARYLDRIGYRGGVEVSEEILGELHLAHMLSVPFENLDISRGDYIHLELSRLFDKVVNRRRGGFCYELNGLFAALLRGLGFNVEMLSAGVYGVDGGSSPDFDHMALLVHLNDDWLADVGFGDSFLAPVPFNGSEGGTNDPAGRFRVARTAGGYCMEQLRGGEWVPQYGFQLTPRQMGDFIERCHFQQTSPDSHFMKGRVCSLARIDGRISLSEMRLITTANGERTERVLSREDEFYSVLLDRFGMRLSPVEAFGEGGPGARSVQV